MPGLPLQRQQSAQAEENRIIAYLLVANRLHLSQWQKKILTAPMSWTTKRISPGAADYYRERCNDTVITPLCIFGFSELSVQVVAALSFVYSHQDAGGMS